MHEARANIVRVDRGCGFVVEINGERLVLTAAHCLPLFRQYVDRALCTELICPLGAIPSIAGECLSIDVINDLAVIGTPPYPPHRAAFERMVLSASPFATAPAKEGRGSVMRLEREIELAGMSGRPIVNEDGAAVSLVASQIPGERRSGPCPHLVAALPAALAPCTRLSRALPPPPSRPRRWTAASTGT
jgi:hypothetical protein